MASDKSYLDYVMEMLGDLDEISFRAMMGEYVLYYKGKVFGGIYDNRFLVKNTNFSRGFMPNAQLELPYDGGKEMLLVENVDDKAFLSRLVDGMYDDLPMLKKRK